MLFSQSPLFWLMATPSFSLLRPKLLESSLIPLSHATSDLSTIHIGMIFKTYPEFNHFSLSPVTTLIEVTSISLLNFRLPYNCMYLPASTVCSSPPPLVIIQKLKSDRVAPWLKTPGKILINALQSPVKSVPHPNIMY